MITTQIEIKDQAVELSTEAFQLFCSDIADMLGLEIACNRQESYSEDIETLKKRFEGLAAVCVIKAEGALNGTFQIVFDHQGLFTLSGVILTIPAGRILEQIQSSSTEEAEQTKNTFAEVSNLLVGAWNRVFQEDLDSRFVQINTFVGTPWDKPEENIGLSVDQQFVFVPYQIAIGSYPVFNCGVIFPKKMLEATWESDTGRPVSSDKETETPEKDPTLEKLSDREEITAEEQLNLTAGTGQNAATSEAIQSIPPSSTILPADATGAALAICAEDIMQKDVLWSSLEDSVQQALTKMQQADAGYMLIGRDGQLEGIVSRSDLTGAISPYLRPVFAKWRRPQDDATLQIKVKWIMSRPVRTIKPQTPLAEIMENMSQFGGGCLPVMDQQGKIQGIVTVFDVFKTLLKRNWNITTAGKPPQSPPLL